MVPSVPSFTFHITASSSHSTITCICNEQYHRGSPAQRFSDEATNFHAWIFQITKMHFKSENHLT
jgi:hypothetical protein